jgi:hypothetical protein
MLKNVKPFYTTPLGNAYFGNSLELKKRRCFEISGGIYNNFEYGILLDEKNTVSAIRSELMNYSSSGAAIGLAEIIRSCEVSAEIKYLTIQKEKSTRREIEDKFNDVLNEANDELLKARLSEGALHNVFEKTILYILQKHKELPTNQIHRLIEEIHPDLCDNEIDRVINGIRFGKRWKHAVRTVQQH